MKKTTTAIIFSSVLLLSGTASACIFEFGFSGKNCGVTCAGGAGAAAAEAISGLPELAPLSMSGCIGAVNPNS